MKATSVKKFGLLSVMMLSSFTAGMCLHAVASHAETGSFSVFLQVYDLIKSEYLVKTTDDPKLVEGAIRGMIDTLGDPYTRYMDPKAFQGMNEERQGSFSGIGIQIGIRDGILSVIAPLEDTPAHKAGLQTNDHIVQIDGKATKGLAVEEAVTLIRGRLGTTVKLTIQRNGGKPFEVPIVRGNIETKSVKSRVLSPVIGYVRLSSFMSNEASHEMEKALKELKGKGMKGYVLDLRSNPGGLLPNAVNIGSLFLNKGAVVHVVDRNGEKQSLNASGNPLIPPSVPMVVLVDGGSASASEILAGALKDYNRATLVGTRTFGKGLVQTVHELPNGGGVAITTNKYLTPNGTDINHKGIEPNVEVKLPQLKDGEMLTDAKDTQLQKALEILKPKVAGM